MISPRQILAFCLILTIALTSGAMAVARVQTDANGTIIICTGTGPMSVAVDANGQPTGPAHICPDCLLSHLDALAPAPSFTLAPTAIPSVQTRLPAPQSVTRRQIGQRTARAPPVV